MAYRVDLSFIAAFLVVSGGALSACESSTGSSAAGGAAASAGGGGRAGTGASAGGGGRAGTGGVGTGGVGVAGAGTGGIGVAGAGSGGVAGGTAGSSGASGTGGAGTGGTTGGTGGTGGSTGGTGGSTGGTGGSTGGTGGNTGGTGGNTGGTAGTGGSTGGTGGVVDNRPPAGNPDGTCAIPSGAGLEDVSSPNHVVGNGTAASCTGNAFIAAVALGGVITFDCGPAPVVITVDRPAKVFNNTGPRIVIDGGGLVTLSGGGTSRILYMNTCDQAQVWTTANCDNQDHPRLTVQNLTFIDGNSKNETKYDGGGAIYASGGRFKVVNSRFFNNVCADTGQDLGGAAIRVFQQYQGLPAYVVGSTFGGRDGLGNTCSNGGGISSIGVSWTVINSLFSYNHAIGNGGNPAQSGTPGGGSGGAIYNDGNTMTLTLCGTRIEYNQVNAYGSAIFFVTNDHTGDIKIDDSVITNNIGGSWYPTYPQISNHDDTPIVVTNSIIQ